MKDFFDFKSLAGNVRNFDLDTDRSKISWSKIRTMKMTSENPNLVKFQCDYDGEVVELDLMHHARRSQDISSAEQLSQKAHKISLQKFKGLAYLCNRNIIPCVHHCFYILQPHEKTE